jgi:hypothetical protein
LAADNPWVSAASGFVMEATAEAVAYASIPEGAALAAAGTLGSRAQIEAELDGILLVIRDFFAMEPDHVMGHCAAMTARLTELEVLLHRVEVRDRQFKQIRTMQVQKILVEVERQFKIASRLIEVRRQDMENMR